MKFVAIVTLLLCIEWTIVISVYSEIEIFRLILIGIVPLILELLKNVFIQLRWPKRWSATLIYDLAIELIRFCLIVVSILLLTSFLSRKYGLYALLFCGNFLMVLAVNALTRFENKTQQEKV